MEMPSYYKSDHEDRQGDWEQLAELTRGLAGGGPLPRSKLVFDQLNLPQARINRSNANTGLMYA